ncbi:MAG: ThiF family adenylyltransferase [Alphaproteobacteria bacterium]
MTNRYARQTVLPELGADGQARLNQASVLCVGAGGLGSPALLYLAAAGIGRIGIVDDDRVDVTNLHRQILFTEYDVHQEKAAVAAQKLSHLNTHTHVDAHPVRLTASNALALLGDYDVILDGTDTVASKFLLNDACVRLGKPLVHASILGFQAQVSVFWGRHGPCYRCLYPTPPKGDVLNCAEAGVIGAMAGMVGATQGLQALMMALGLSWCQSHGLAPLLGRLWVLDARNMNTRLLTVTKNPSCPVCAGNPEAVRLQHEPDAPCVTRHPHDVRVMDVAQALLCSEETVFLDVREPFEWRSGHITGARHLPLGHLLAEGGALDDLPLNAPIVVYCQHGIRSLTGAAHLQRLGYTNISHLEGGFVRWPQGPLSRHQI